MEKVFTELKSKFTYFPYKRTGRPIVAVMDLC